MNYIVEIPKQQRMSLMAPQVWSIVPQELENSISKFFQKRHKEMETKLSMLDMQNLLTTCWFQVIIMCGTEITFFIQSIMYYIIDVFSFSFIFFPIERSVLTQKQNGQLIYYINEFTNHFVSEFFSSFLGRLTLIGFL